MLRVGLTGDLGSGKSTVARLLASRGAVVFSSDEMARRMMQPGETVYTQIVERFGPSVLTGDSFLDRAALARFAFQEGRVDELNAIVHPAVLLAQAHLLDELARTQPHAIAVIESALIFTTTHALQTDSGSPAAPSWRERFDCIVLVTAPLEQKVARFVERLSQSREDGSAPRLTQPERTALEQDARRRLALQTSANEAHAAESLVIENSSGLEALSHTVDRVWAALQQAEAATG